MKRETSIGTWHKLGPLCHPIREWHVSVTKKMAKTQKTTRKIRRKKKKMILEKQKSGSMTYLRGRMWG